LIRATKRVGLDLDEVVAGADDRFVGANRWTRPDDDGES